MMIEQDLREKTLSPQEVRRLLGVDNKEIVELCKSASILPRRDKRGQTYFSYDEVKNLREIQKRVSTGTAVAEQEKQPVLAAILSSIKDIENNISDKISNIIDKKLEGMDEVVVELIRCKTDNETLRQKIIDLNKEIYQLKNDLNCYKPVALGLYKKRDRQTWD